MSGPLRVRPGRNRERSQLLDALRGADVRPTPTGILVSGPPGIGRSVLVDDVVEEVVDRFLVLRVRADDGVGLAPWRRLGSAADPPGSPSAAAAELLASWRPRPTLVVIDDLHRLDGPAIEVAIELLRAPVNVTVLASVRDLAGDLRLVERFRSACAGEIRPGPLNGSAIRVLVQRRTGRRPAPDVAEELERRTGGNPLLLSTWLESLSIEELRRRAGDTGTLRVTPELEVAVRRLLRGLPEDVLDIAARLAHGDRRLPDEVAPIAVGLGLVTVGADGSASLTSPVVGTVLATDVPTIGRNVRRDDGAAARAQVRPGRTAPPDVLHGWIGQDTGVRRAAERALDGRLYEADQLLWRVVREARLERDVHRLAESAVALARLGVSHREVRHQVVEEAWEALPVDDPVRADLAAAKSVLLFPVDLAESRSQAELAVGIASMDRTPQRLGTALLERAVVGMGPDDTGQVRKDALEALAILPEADPGRHEARAILVALAARDGDLQAVRAFAGSGPHGHEVRRHRSSLEAAAGIAQIEGDFAAADRLLRDLLRAEVLHRAERVGLEQSLRVELLRWETARIARRPRLEVPAGQEGWAPLALAAAAFLRCPPSGATRAAMIRRELPGIEGIRRDGAWLATIALQVRPAAAVGMRSLLGELMDLLRPHADRWVSVGPGILLGPVRWYLAEGWLGLGDRARAASEAAAAASMAQQQGAVVWRRRADVLRAVAVGDDLTGLVMEAAVAGHIGAVTDVPPPPQGEPEPLTAEEEEAALASLVDADLESMKQRLGIDGGRIRRRLDAVYRKLGVRSQVELALRMPPPVVDLREPPVRMERTAR